MSGGAGPGGVAGVQRQATRGSPECNGRRIPRGQTVAGMVAQKDADAIIAWIASLSTGDPHEEFAGSLDSSLLKSGVDQLQSAMSQLLRGACGLADVVDVLEALCSLVLSHVQGANESSTDRTDERLSRLSQAADNLFLALHMRSEHGEAHGADWQGESEAPQAHARGLWAHPSAISPEADAAKPPTPSLRSLDHLIRSSVAVAIREESGQRRSQPGRLPPLFAPGHPLAQPSIADGARPSRDSSRWRPQRTQTVARAVPFGSHTPGRGRPPLAATLSEPPRVHPRKAPHELWRHRGPRATRAEPTMLSCLAKAGPPPKLAQPLPRATFAHVARLRMAHQRK